MNEWSEVMIHVRRGDEFLVAHRSPDSGGYWHTIAGKVEEGEEPDAAAVRELREETRLETDSLETIGEFAYVREDWESEPGLRVHVKAFLVDVEPGWEPVLNEEHDEYRWLLRDEAAELLFWPEPAQLLRALP
ncbi:MAG TPA: NUDIX domain-containing protein [Gaiellaceae bacterium]|nr:NUDIX domain-containing protein [Gaiellaceae bacterium]